jgi:hypothetical protein
LNIANEPVADGSDGTGKKDDGGGICEEENTVALGAIVAHAAKL